MNTHIHWNPKFDFVKYAQAFWLLKNISEFLTENNLSLDTTPLVSCGDFNSKANSAVYHMMMNKDYLITEKSGRAHPKTGVKAFRTTGDIRQTENYEIFKLVKEDYESNLPSLKNVLGRLDSSTSFYNQEFDLNKKYEDNDDGLLEWAEDNLQRHPEYSMFQTNCHSNIDFIFFNPSTMTVKSILEIPTREEVSKEIDIPSRLFPSDHLRMQVQFEVYFKSQQ